MQQQEIGVTSARTIYRHFVWTLDDDYALCGVKRPSDGWTVMDGLDGIKLQCDRCTRRLFGKMN